MERADKHKPAPRSEADLASIAAAYRSGHVFLGHLDIPVIDLRHYLEDELDMHHLSASFATRSRLLKGQGHAGNQLIWVTRKPHNGEQEAFAIMDQWMANIRDHANKSVVENRPATAMDSCFDRHGTIIASGETVWDGEWNDKPGGACSEVYPSYSDSRRQAGGVVSGDIMKCHLQSVDTAIENGLYGVHDMRNYRERLAAIFPQGVCDFSRGDQGRPEGLLLVADEVQQPLKKAAAKIGKRKSLPKADMAGMQLTLDESESREATKHN